MTGEFYSCLYCAYACDQFFFSFSFLGGLLETDGGKSACIALLNDCWANEEFCICIYTAIPRK